jgi:hypothetical protein
MDAQIGPPADYQSVTPRMVVPDVANEVDFLGTVFDAAGEIEPGKPAERRPHIRAPTTELMSTATAPTGERYGLLLDVLMGGLRSCQLCRHGGRSPSSSEARRRL